MGIKGILITLVSIIIVAMAIVQFMPEKIPDYLKDPTSNSWELTGNPNYTFYMGIDDAPIQYYPNTRFAQKEITFGISEDCSQEKKQNAREGFQTIQDLTVLKFYEVQENPQITVECDETIIDGPGLFQAGEGGPTKTILGDNINVVIEGIIILKKESRCEKANVATHELLHVLGFNHSKNDYNLMFPISHCSQRIGEEIINKINEVYSIEPLPDLNLIEAVSNFHDGTYLDINFSIKNEGIIDAKASKLIIKTDNNIEKEVDLPEIKIGSGLNSSLSNIKLNNPDFTTITLTIEADFKELSKENNQIILN